MTFHVRLPTFSSPLPNILAWRFSSCFIRCRKSSKFLDSRSVNSTSKRESWHEYMSLQWFCKSHVGKFPEYTLSKLKFYSYWEMCLLLQTSFLQVGSRLGTEFGNNIRRGINLPLKVKSTKGVSKRCKLKNKRAQSPITRVFPTLATIII